MDEVLLDQLLQGMEAISSLIVQIEDASDDLAALKVSIRKVARCLADIVDLPGQLLEQIDEVLE